MIKYPRGIKMKLTDSVLVLKGIGQKTADLFEKMNLKTIEDLLFYFPRGYEKYQEPIVINQLFDGMNAFCGKVDGRPVSKKVRHLTITTLSVSDLTGKIQLTFFNMPFIANALKPGEEYIFRGVIRETAKTGAYCEHPKIFKKEEYQKRMQSLYPVYPLVKGVTHATITKAILQVLSSGFSLEERLPFAILQKYDLLPIQDAILQIHLPHNEISAANARRRLVFDEFFLFLFSIALLRNETEKMQNCYPCLETADIPRFIERLPFRLTKAQNNVWNEVKQELMSEFVMNRLIQGDVGSGKTIIAVLAMIMSAANGYQSAMMAPTEVLARQHFELVKSMVTQYALPLKPILLTGSLSAKEKKLAQNLIQDNEVNVVFGTHALIQDHVHFHTLSLVITDEQHRFGVRQRETFAEKGMQTHVLVMSATPIPRSLAMILFGDMNLSVMDELPMNRLPIKNCVVDHKFRKKAYELMQSEIHQGRQVYVICPMIEEGEMDGLENVSDYKTKLKSFFPDSIRIEALHGKMKPIEKNRIMERYAEGLIDILVSTTVIEVGINVPNATIMMIENAERFGLAQLHQLRGRVGRGKHQSYCIFVSGTNNQTTMDRLSILNNSNDGFKIAEEDMKLRGPGDLFGIRQSGMMDFVLADVFQDATILQEAQKEVAAILVEDPTLSKPEHARLKWLKEHDRYHQVDFRTI